MTIPKEARKDATIGTVVEMLQGMKAQGISRQAARSVTQAASGLHLSQEEIERHLDEVYSA